jgi:RNA polymerase-binding transcription factor DksA
MSTQIDLELFRERLLQERQRVIDAISYLHKENPGSIADETGDLVAGSGDNHLADTATETVGREIDYTLEENSGNVLREIELALERVDAGTYGVCSVCGKQIEPERLEYLPWATLCAADARGSRG